ncbi:MAG: DNA gyrase subunit A [Myxococcales bacterium]|jgi:DNA gyrase subunit A|nr:DNA gyrase subunit A [Myxococcales bacterium]
MSKHEDNETEITQSQDETQDETQGETAPLSHDDARDGLPPDPPGVSRINIETEMKHSYLDYAMSVIVGRALPDVRDGLKPVHRRILFAMHELKNTWNATYKKSARVVGDVIGKYHPHGDSAVYDALVRMAQDFSMREMLVDGQGNFGSIDGDPPAAMRYTEVRMARLTTELLGDIEKNTVNFADNYDGSLREPSVLPAAYPNLLVNGSGGIAVGMATNIAPHNLGEVIDGVIALARDPEISDEALLGIIPGPDFPTGGIICGRSGIYRSVTTGRGIIIMRAKIATEEIKSSGREQLIITELPYQVNKARLIEKIAELVRDKRIEGIAALRDESDRSGMRIVIELKRDTSAQVLENQLLKLTPLQSSFGVINLAIHEGRPKVFTLKGALDAFLSFREETVRRRCVFELNKAKARLHILEGLKIALDHIDAVVALIRASRDPEEARNGLMAQFSLSELQAREILSMRLQRLTGLERDKILEEIEALRIEIAHLEDLLAIRDKLIALIISELEAVKAAYATPRRTEIIDDESDINIEDLIAVEDMVVTVSNLGYIKRTATAEYRSQHRGGKGLTGMDTREDDFVSEVFVASTHDNVLFFSDRGKVYCKKVYQVPLGSRASRGKAIVNFVGMEAGEKVAAVLPVSVFESDQHVITCTRNGYVKKTDLMAYAQIRQTGIIGVVIDEGDELISAGILRAGDHVILGTRNGQAIRFEHESDVRPMGRQSRGVRGIEIRKDGTPDDAVVDMAVISENTEETLLTISENGYGKRTALDEYRTQRRGGMGLLTIKVSERNGNVVAVKPVAEDDHLMLITNGGKIIRIAANSIPVLGRNTQGVRLIRLAEDEKVGDVERLADQDSATADVVEVAEPSIPPPPPEPEEENG